MKKKVFISLTLLLSPLVMALALRTYDNYRYHLQQDPVIENPESIAIETFKEGEWSHSRKETFDYDDQGKVTKSLTQFRKDDQWANRNLMAYSYDPKSGLEVERIWSNWIDSHWTPKFRFKAERNEADQLVREVVEEYKDDKWVVVRKNEIEYKDGKKLYQTYFNLVDKEWQFSWQDEYQFVNENLAKKTGKRWTEGEWTATLTTDYSYNRNGQRIREVINRVNQGKEEQWRKTNFFLDQNGTKTLAQIYIWAASAWTDSEKHTYQYNL